MDSNYAAEGERRSYPGFALTGSYNNTLYNCRRCAAWLLR